jgi:hypothetical protein
MIAGILFVIGISSRKFVASQILYAQPRFFIPRLVLFGLRTAIRRILADYLKRRGFLK